MHRPRAWPTPGQPWQWWRAAHDCQANTAANGGGRRPGTARVANPGRSAPGRDGRRRAGRRAAADRRVDIGPVEGRGCGRCRNSCRSVRVTTGGMAMFKLQMDTDNAAFGDDDKGPEVARILREIAERIEDGDEIGR